MTSFLKSVAGFIFQFCPRPRWRLVAIAVGLALGLSLLICSGERISPQSAVPEYMPLAYWAPGSERTAPDTAFWPVTAWQAALEQDLKELQALLMPDSLLSRPRERLAAFTLSPGDSMRALWIWAYPKAVGLEVFFEKNSDVLLPGELQFRGRKIYQIRLGAGQMLSVCGYRNLLIASKRGYLVEDALAQLARGKNRVWGKGRAPEAPALIIAPQSLALALSPLVLPDYKAMLGLWQAGDARLWTLHTDHGGALLTAPRAVSKRRASGDAAQLNIVLGYVPDNAVWLNRTEMPTAWAKNKWLREWAGTPIAEVLIEPRSADIQEAHYLCIGIGDSAKMRQTLLKYGAQYGFKSAPDAYMSFPIYEFARRGDMWSGLSLGLRTVACADLGRVAVFAESRRALEIWIDKYLGGQLLINAPDFASAVAGRNLDGDYFAALRAVEAPRMAGRFFAPQKCPVDTPALYAAARSSWWMAVSRPGAPDSIRIWKAEKISGMPLTAGAVSLRWKTETAAEIARGPYLTQAGGLRCLFVQDVEHRVYCLDMKGNILFRKQLDGPLLSPVIGLDDYGSGAPIYVANTTNQIWMFDGLGADTRGFPLRLQSKAVNGLCAAVLSGVGQACLFVLCDNGSAYGFDLYGRPLAGWNPLSEAGYSPWPIVHFSRRDKDYLAILDVGNRQVRVLGPDGADRFPAVAFDGLPGGPLQADAKSASPRMVIPLSDGRFQIVNLAGEGFHIRGGKGPGPFKGVFSQLLGDARYEYVCAGLDQIRGLGYRGDRLETLFEAHPNGCDTLFALDYSGFGGWDSRRRRIMLFDAQGRRAFDTPLAGSGPFVLANMSESEGYFLFTPLDNQVMAYFLPR